MVPRVPDPIEIRPMRGDDVPAVHQAGVAAFEDLDRRSGVPYPGPAPPLEVAHARYHHLLATDPGGAWVAERNDSEIVGASVGLVREGIWGLSYLVVIPGAQSAGTGRELLSRAWEHGRDARGWIVLSSQDPRALRAYARLGLALHPCLMATGTPRGISAPAGVRPGSVDDLPLTESVDRAVRGAAHGADLRVQVESGATLLVVPGRGYATVRDGNVLLLAALDDAAARDLLLAALASAGGGPAMVDCISAAQGWAVAPCLDAGLELRPSGALFLGGDLGPFTPYVPNGAYL